MTTTLKLISAALALGAAVSAQAQIGGNVPVPFDTNAVSTLDRAMVAEGARNAIANHAFHDEFFGNQTPRGESTVSRADVRAQAIKAIQEGTLSVGE